MIDKLYIQQWIALIVGIIFLIISIYTLFKGVKRDKVIAIGVFLICTIMYFTAEIRIRNHNAKAAVYFGIHQLVDYNNSADCQIEIFPDNTYLVFDHKDKLLHGEWKLIIADDQPNRLMLDGSIFGVGEFAIEDPLRKKSKYKQVRTKLKESSDPGI